MLLSHERPHYIAGERVREEYLSIVDLVSTMTMSHILQARSARKGLEGHILLLDIKNVLCKIREKYSKYKPIIDSRVKVLVPSQNNQNCGAVRCSEVQ